MKIAGAIPSGRDFKTNDYVKLCSPLFLAEYEIKLKAYKDVPGIRPFAQWDATKPTKSLTWYDAYNKTKHDREIHFNEATLLNCIYAIAANIILFCVRYSPFSLSQGASTLSSIINQSFQINLVNTDPATFYIPKMVFPNTRRKDLVCSQGKNNVQPWVCNQLII